MAEISRREALEAAYDAAESAAEGGETQGQETPKGGEPYEREAVAAKAGQETPPKEQAQEVEGTPPAEKDTPPSGKAAPKETPPPEGAIGSRPAEGGAAIKPPISWRGEEKAHWDKIPRPAQEAIARRELETQQALSKSGQARQFVRDFGQTVMPYAHLIRAQGSTPLAAVDNLMRTAANLMTGDPQRKAAVVAEIIANYAVDVNVLDEALVAQQKRGPIPTAGQGVLPPQFAAALKPVYDFMSSVEQQREQYQQHIQEQTYGEVEQWGQGKPYFEELRQEMGDLMEFAANKGRTMSLDDAYTRVLALHPELQTEPPGTQNRSQLSQAASTLARARRAGASLKGGPSGGGTANPAPRNRREALEQAWDEQMNS